MRNALRSLALMLGLAPPLASCENFGGVCPDGGDAAPLDAESDAPSDAPIEGAGDAIADDAMSDGPPLDATRLDGFSSDGSSAGMDGSPSDSSGDATPVTVAGVRIANWSPDAPAIDFCLASHGTGNFQGPILASHASQSADAAPQAPTCTTTGSSPAVCFPQASSYTYVSPGQYDARIVVAGAPDCSSGIAADATMLAMMPAGALQTIALLGETHPVGSDPALTLATFLDDQRPTGAIALRFVQAAPSVSKADMGTGSGGMFKPVFTGIGFAQSSAKQATAADAGAAADGGLPTIDKNGYASMSALSSATLSARPSGAMQDSVVAAGVSAASGSVLTVALVGLTTGPSVNDAGVQQGQLVECVDNAGTTGSLSNCRIISQ